MKVFDKGASYTKGSKKSAVMQDGPYKGGKAKVSKRNTAKVQEKIELKMQHKLPLIIHS